MSKFRTWVNDLRAHPVRVILCGSGFTIALSGFSLLGSDLNQRLGFPLGVGALILGGCLFFLGCFGSLILSFFHDHVKWRFLLRKPALPKSEIPIEPDLPFEEVIQRIVLLKGDVPDQNDRDSLAQYVDDLNHDIASKVRFKKLTVFGSRNRTPPQVISGALMWHGAHVDVAGRCVWFDGAWEKMIYERIMFVSAEVDEVWPPIE